MKLRLAICPWGGGYTSAAVEQPWTEGEVREVSSEVGGYLLSTFPDQFVRHGEPVAQEPAAEPAASKPRKR